VPFAGFFLDAVLELICWFLDAQVGNAFVQQYYLVLHQSPDLVYRFYQDASRVARPVRDAASVDGMESVTSMEVSGTTDVPRSGRLFLHFVLVVPSQSRR
jgi:hypothetical protein